MNAPDPTIPWRKSSRSSGNGQCVEVRVQCDVIDVRDSKNPAGGVLAFSPTAWTAFTMSIRNDR